MGIFDKLKSNMGSSSTQPSQLDKSVRSETFTFYALPESLAELQSIPEASMSSPFQTAALTVLALCAYVADQNIGIEMLDYLKGPRPLSVYDKQFLKDRLTTKNNLFVPFSYFNGATPQNDYTPSEPFTIVVSSNPYSYRDEEGAHYATLYIASGGADSPRPVTLRQKGDQWMLWEGEKSLFTGIRTAKSQDPWA